MTSGNGGGPALSGRDSAGRMRERFARSERDLWRGAGDAWTWMSELVTATAVWAGVGYLFDRVVFHSWPVGFAVGAVVGNATGIWWLYRRFIDEAAREERERRGPGRSG